MQLKKQNIFLYVLIIAGLACALLINFQRHKVEQANNQVEMLMEYEDLLKLAANTGHSSRETLADFKAKGITSLAVYETTLEKLVAKGTVSVLSNGEVANWQRLDLDARLPWAKNLTKEQLSETGVYVIGEQGVHWQELVADVQQRFAKSKIIADGQKPVLFIAGDYKSIIEQHLGFSTQEMQAVVQAGFYLTVRPTNYQNVNKENINHVFARLDAAKVPVTSMLFSGKQSLGAEAELELTAQKLKERHITLAMTEHIVQLQFAPMAGIEKLAKMLDYNVARLYVIDPAEQKKISVKEAVRRFALTDEERNIRVNFLKTFEQAELDQDLYAMNLDYIDQIAQKVQARGFALNKAGVFSEFFPSKLLLIPIIAGAVAACVLYLSCYWQFSYYRQNLLAMILTVILSALLLITNGTSVRQLIAFASAVVFPTLSMLYIITIWDKTQQPLKSFARILLNASGQLSLAVTLSLIGGMYLAAILSDLRFFLELDIYRGVKLTFIMPIVLVALYYVYKHNLFNNKSTKAGFAGLLSQLKTFLNYPIYVKSLVVAGILLFVAWVFIGRSGHTAGVPVPAIEVKLRLFLEEVMYARPREKEFMVGHVAFFLAATASYRFYPRILTFIFVCLATIGQGSLVQTFAHMRTPVVMSVIRALDGLALGIVCAVLVSFIFNIIYPYAKKLESELNTDE